MAKPLPSRINWLRGATVARLTPDQKAACSNHVGVRKYFWYIHHMIRHLLKGQENYVAFNRPLVYTTDSLETYMEILYLRHTEPRFFWNSESCANLHYNQTIQMWLGNRVVVRPCVNPILDDFFFLPIRRNAVFILSVLTSYWCLSMKIPGKVCQLY